MKYHSTDWFVFALLPYNLTVVGVVVYSKQTFRVKCKEMDVMVKKISKGQEELIEKLASLQLPFCEQIILNQKRKAVTCYLDEYFYVTLYLKDLTYDVYESNRYLSSILSSLHAQTFHIVKSDVGYFENYLHFFRESLQQKQIFDKELFMLCIKEEYKSPALWLYLKQNDLGIPFLKSYEHSINEFEKLTQNKTSIRKVINFGHFSKDSMDYNRKILIGLHKTCDNSPVFDLYHWICSCDDDTMLDYLRVYFTYFSLMPYEKYLLICLLYERVSISFKQDEFLNIKMLLKCQYWLDFIHGLEDLMGIQINQGHPC